ncbi:hypothetical protein BDD12DRAFT_980992 [Trichophaea hybrida]|nr:hypothetical protein BDD12DRAFT_980992 [Trichophaea hybrida]
MKNHIFTTHLKPFQCPGCKKRFEKRALRTHLMSCKHAVQASITETMFEGSSNLKNQQLTTLVDLFKGTPTKAEMRRYMYRNNVKLYDCEKQHEIIDNLQSHSHIPHAPPVIQQRSRRSRRGLVHRQRGVSDGGSIPRQQSTNFPDLSGMVTPVAANHNGGFGFGAMSEIQNHSNSKCYSGGMPFLRSHGFTVPQTLGLQSLSRTQPGVQHFFEPVLQDQTASLNTEFHRNQQAPQARYPDEASAILRQENMWGDTSCFDSSLVDGQSSLTYNGGFSLEVMQSMSSTQASPFEEFLHSRSPSIQNSRPVSAGCGSGKTPPSAGLPWNERRLQNAGLTHHRSPLPDLIVGLDSTTPQQNTKDQEDEVPAPVPSAIDLSRPADPSSTPLDGSSSFSVPEQDIIPTSSSPVNPTNEDQNIGKETIKYGLTEAELDSLGYNVWDILDDVMSLWQKLSARATYARKALVKLLYRDSCPLIEAILDHGVQKGVVNRSGISSRQKGLLQTPDLELPATSSGSIAASTPGDELSSAQVPEKDIATTCSASLSSSATIVDENSNSGEENIIKYGLTKEDLSSLGYVIYNKLDAFIKSWDILSERAASDGQTVAKLFYSDSCPLIQAILTHGVDKGVVDWVDIAPRQKSLPQSPGRAVLSVIDSAMGASATVPHGKSEFADSG